MAKILVTDDAAFVRSKIRKFLEGEGFEVLEAENGQQAVDQYKAASPDLVLMDITMPVMDGIAAVSAIKGLDPNAKIVMCSAMGQQAMVINAIKAGAKDFVLKPFEPERVLAAVKKLLD